MRSWGVNSKAELSDWLGRKGFPATWSSLLRASTIFCGRQSVRLFGRRSRCLATGQVARTICWENNCWPGLGWCGIAAERVPLMWLIWGRKFGTSGHQNLGHSSRVARVRAQHRPGEVRRRGQTLGGHRVGPRSPMRVADPRNVPGLVAITFFAPATSPLAFSLWWTTKSSWWNPTFSAT